MPIVINRIVREFLTQLLAFSKNVGLSEHSNPLNDGLKISIASLLYEPKYIEVTFPYDKDDEFSDFQGKDITGTITGATATVGTN